MGVDLIGKVLKMKEELLGEMNAIEAELREVIAEKTDFKEIQRAVNNRITISQAEQLVRQALEDAEFPAVKRKLERTSEENERKVSKQEFAAAMQQVKE